MYPLIKYKETLKRVKDDMLKTVPNVQVSDTQAMSKHSVARPKNMVRLRSPLITSIARFSVIQYCPAIQHYCKRNLDKHLVFYIGEGAAF